MTESREQLVDTVFAEPEGDGEQAVARVIAEVLGIDRVGRLDSFYDFGGTSLAAIKVCARLEHERGWRVDPAWLFTSDVVADFARKVQSEAALAAET
ncbi:phosphopantetheine-binding protein [Actinoplanes sp. NPDC026623]|uniref:phosphopantetheine-binding protein n=1 Tax=Actinoplanes sp. NPDC026623 TaxID=3155610 RepID=UPI0033D31F48